MPEHRLLAGLNALTTHHRAACPEYARAAGLVFGDGQAATLAEVPFLPVGLFKTHDLRSVPADRIVRTLTSSGTTGAAVSRIHLDAESAAAQTRAVARVMTGVLGPARLPMVILDPRSALADRTSPSARAAGILGMMPFGRDHLFAADEAGVLDVEALRAYLEKHAGETVFLYGRTFVAWDALGRQAAGLDLSGAVLVHGGGWKRLQHAAVGREAFRAGLRAATGLTRVHDFYGMAEQIGSIFIECEQGVFHAPDHADVLVRDPHSLAEAPDGATGVLEVLSLLPTSYPGHAVLTEDLGRIVGRDGCPCGRPGTRFAVSGRLPKAELRGCSDTALAA
jgi:hypothetical protein